MRNRFHIYLDSDARVNNSKAVHAGDGELHAPSMDVLKALRDRTPKVPGLRDARSTNNPTSRTRGI